MQNTYRKSDIPDDLAEWFEPAEIGLETSPEQYIANLVEVFSRVRDILSDDGTLWINIGDSYAANRGYQVPQAKGGNKHGPAMATGGRSQKAANYGIKPKDLIGIPWMLAFALRADGWYLRQDIIWCLSGGAWLYAKTQKGEMPIMVKDLVRLDPKTVKLWNGTKWTQVLGWGQNPSPTDKMELVLRSGERIGCTGDHLWPTQRGNVKASDLVVGDIIQTCMLPEPILQNPGHLSDDAAWFLGLYLAEGSMAGDTIQLSLNVDEIHFIGALARVAEHYGGYMTHTVNGQNLSVRMYGKILNALVHEYVGGYCAHDKHLNVSAWRLSNALLKKVADGYLDGDSHFDTKNNRHRLGFARNYSLERDLRTLAARLGAILTINPSVSTCQTGKFAAFRGEWRWETSGHWNQKQRGEVVCIRGSRARKFWDISVEDEPHLFALSSGVLTHNCKPNPMPESVTDRCTKAHEYVFLLSKKPKYYYNHEAIMEESVYATDDPAQQFGREGQLPSIPGQNHAQHRPTRKDVKKGGFNSKYAGDENGRVGDESFRAIRDMRNKRSVWTIATKPYKGAHFAVFPEALITPCILAGCPPGGIVLDPFMGSGTTASVAIQNGMGFAGCELNHNFVKLQKERLGLFAGDTEWI